jgi:AcrR family transcriptional regulator
MPSTRRQEPVGQNALREPRRRPGGRTGAHTEAILDATIDVMVAKVHLTFQAVAERAGVSRATMYRRWPTPAHLAVQAVRQRAADAIRVPDHGSLTKDLTDVLGQIARFISSPIGRAVIAAGLQAEPGAAPLVSSSWEERWDQVEPVFSRAIERCELDPNVDAPALFAQLAGSLYFRLQVMGEAIDSEWVQRVLRANGVTANR